MTFADIVYGKIVPIFDNFIIPLLYTLAFLLFMIGMARFFFTGGEENRKKGKEFALWGIIGLFVIFSVWALVQVFLSLIMV